MLTQSAVRYVVAAQMLIAWAGRKACSQKSGAPEQVSSVVGQWEGRVDQAWEWGKAGPTIFYVVWSSATVSQSRKLVRAML